MCVSVCVCCASSCDFACLLLASCDVENEKFTLSCLLHIPSAARTNVIIWNVAQSSAAARPQLSHPTCSLAQAEVSGSGRGRAAACKHGGAQGPTRRQSCRPRCCVISSRSCCRGRSHSYGSLQLLWGSYTHTSTQTYTLAKL